MMMEVKDEEYEKMKKRKEKKREQAVGGMWLCLSGPARSCQPVLGDDTTCLAPSVFFACAIAREYQSGQHGMGMGWSYSYQGYTVQYFHETVTVAMDRGFH
jgi:hypothetical protein